ncbi:MAG TPA: mandelate racemase/muconate lactonizing enzyme family protein [Bryobacteraceae bacterium]|jgi:galactonate dehydratase|nr:mandelate racemase/muconate lactonizing enzyme family protein [Bryobacteraceae bacterium]
MIVTDLQTQIIHLGFRNCILLKVSTDEGITGISETVMKRKSLTIEQSILQLRSFLIGKDPTEIEDHWEKMYRDSFWVGGPMHCTAISAIDCALWDILGKSLGAPVHKLLGGPTRREVPVYCHCPSGATPEEFARNIAICKRDGYRAAKTTLPLFYGQSQPTKTTYSGTNGAIDRTWKETEYLDPSVFGRIREFFVAAREAAGPNFGIGVDCHGRLNLKGAMRLCRELEGLDLMFIEEPVPPENVDVLAAVQRDTSIPIAAGERWATIHGVRQFLERQAVDILQCDLVNCGGITGLKKIAAIAEAHYVGMAPHNPNGPVATLMNLQFAACIPNYYMLETIGGESDWQLWRQILHNDISLHDGQLPVPCAPGFGVSLNEGALAKYPYLPQEGWR